MEKIKNTPQVRQTRWSSLYLPTSRYKIAPTQCFHIYSFVQDITFLMINGVKCPSTVYSHNCFLFSLSSNGWPTQEKSLENGICSMSQRTVFILIDLPFCFSTTCKFKWTSNSHPVFRWAATWQNQQNGCAPSEDSDQPGHSPSLIRVFAVRMKKAWVLSYPLSAQRRLWSESSLGAHSFCWFCHVAIVVHWTVKLNCIEPVASLTSLNGVTSVYHWYSAILLDCFFQKCTVNEWTLWVRCFLFSNFCNDCSLASYIL